MKYRHIFLLWGVVLAGWSTLGAQTLFPELAPVFQDDLLPRIDIWLPPDSLAQLLAPGNEELDYPWHATFVFNNGAQADTVTEIGFRLRGNTSLYARKKSFKVSFNSYVPGRKWEHLEKLNLNGEHNDPTVARSKIAWDLLRRMGVPAPRANHVRLYINGAYFGLYVNVEHIDEQFVQLRFGNNDGNLYKCLWPADLAYKGADPDLYKAAFSGRQAYELVTNLPANDYSDLAHFIDVLNNTPLPDLPCALEAVLDVDTWLRVMAFDVLAGNWDGPVFNKNNFYLYHNTANGRFEVIPYDLDNTLGIDWLGMDWSMRNIYAWAPGGGELRPLYTRVLQVPEYKNRFSYYVKSFAGVLFSDAVIFPYIDSLKSRIAGAAAIDPYRPLDYGFTFDDFNKAYTQALPHFHTPIGLKSYIVVRRQSALQQLQAGNIFPVITALEHNAPNAAQAIWVAATVADDGPPPIAVQVCYRWSGQGLVCQDMYDDGVHLDGLSGDGRYGAILPATGQATTVEYFVRATDALGQQSREPRCGMAELPVGKASTAVVINEFMASNTSTYADAAGEYDDWIELLNTGDVPLYLGNFYLSDNENTPGKWQLPPVWIQPQQHLVFWADGDTGQGPEHASFKLDAGGEFIGIFENTGGNLLRVDGYAFGPQQADVALGRLPDGTGPFQPVLATPGATNQPLSDLTEPAAAAALKFYPNPATNACRLIAPAPLQGNWLLNVADARGRLIRRQEMTGVSPWIDLSGLPSGLYMITLAGGAGLYSGILVKQ